VNGRSDQGSTAEIAKLLGLPVVLVVDASNAARSMGAIVKGFQTFDPYIRFVGVILNGAAGTVHAELLRDSIAPLGVPVLGWFPKITEAVLEERHLGLVTAGERTWSRPNVELLVHAAESYIDLDHLIAGSALDAGDEPPKTISFDVSEDPVRIGIAKDKAFSFYYEASLDTLRNAGAELVDFSPLSDPLLPPSLDGLYIGGGYPEIYAAELSQNQSFVHSLREFVKRGGAVYAECGGLMYLAENLTTLDGRRHAMASVLPISIEMLDRLDGFGYTEVQVLEDCPIAARGMHLRGHSFHYSRVTRTEDIRRSYRTRRVLGGDEGYEGYCSGNVLASYIHLSFSGNPEAARHFVQHCRQAKVVAQ
jgi:cobyrinic acid a,c-diamide synthase